MFMPKFLFFVTYSILTGQTKVEFVIYWVLILESTQEEITNTKLLINNYSLDCLSQGSRSKMWESTYVNVKKSSSNKSAGAYFTLKDSIFSKLVHTESQVNHETKLFWFKGVHLVFNGHILKVS